MFNSKILVASKPLDYYLFNIWKKHLENRGVDFILSNTIKNINIIDNSVSCVELLNEEKFEKKQIPIHEIKNLVVTPRFKNENRSNINLTLKVEVYSEGYPSNSQSLTLDSFKNIDVPKMLEDAGIPSDETTIFILKILIRCFHNCFSS